MAKTKQHKEFEPHFNPDLPIAEDFNCNEDWRFELPVWDTEKCIKCGVCYLSCPDGAIYQNEEGYYAADLRYCKGLLCAALSAGPAVLPCRKSLNAFPGKPGNSQIIL